MTVLAFIILLVFAPFYSDGQTVSDPDFKVKLTSPLYPHSNGPLLLYDQYHYNAFSLSGQYKGFADVVQAEGYRLRAYKAAIERDVLSQADVFVTVNALSHPSHWDLPNTSVYREEEIETLYRWVHDEGGSLLIITDQMPSAGAVSSLAARFGFNLINGFTHRVDGQPELFTREIGNLLPSPVTDRKGREVHHLRCWGGSGFIPPEEAKVFAVLGEAYRIYLPSKIKDTEMAIRNDMPYIMGNNLANGALLNCGKGRICIFSDASSFTALLKGINSEKIGMNHPDGKDQIFLLLNVLEWLSQP